MQTTRTTPIDQVVTAALQRDRARRTDKRIEKVASLVGTVVATFVSGWMFMLAVGVIHHEWIHACPTLAFGHSMLIGVLLRSALQIPNPSTWLKS